MPSNVVTFPVRYAFVVGKRLPETAERLGVALIGYPDGSPVAPPQDALLSAALQTFRAYWNVRSCACGTLCTTVVCELSVPCVYVYFLYTLCVCGCIPVPPLGVAAS